MKLLRFLVCFVVYCSSFSVNCAPDWSYAVGGPASWPASFPSCSSNGSRLQSPVDITGTSKDRVPPIGTFVNYNNTPSSISLGNDGKKILLRVTSVAGSRPHLRFSARKTYELEHVEFHWGSTNTAGSEHAVNGTKYPLEMHAVHSRAGYGGMHGPKKYAIVSVLFQISPTNNTGLDKFLSFMSVVVNPGSSLNVPPFAPSALVPPFTTSFYSYAGSLTAPPCAGPAIYFIRHQIANVSASQLVVFRRILNDKKLPMSGNWRPLQPRNGRNIYTVRP